MKNKLDVTEKLKEEKNKLKQKLVLKEQRLRNHEKKLNFNKLVEVGKLAEKANLDKIDSAVLLGAFIEISRNKEDFKNLERWKNLALEYENNQKQDKNNSVRLTIKFDATTPDEKILTYLKETKFKWNRFRQEFYGCGNKDEISKFLTGIQCNVEEIL